MNIQLYSFVIIIHHTSFVKFFYKLRLLYFKDYNSEIYMHDKHIISFSNKKIITFNKIYNSFIKIKGLSNIALLSYYISPPTHSYSGLPVKLIPLPHPQHTPLNDLTQLSRL